MYYLGHVLFRTWYGPHRRLKNEYVPSDAKFFEGLGARIRELRRAGGLSQEDMITLGFSVRYWQKVEAGKPITLRTLLRICRLFSTPMHTLVRGLDEDLKKQPPRRRGPSRRRTRRRK